MLKTTNYKTLTFLMFFISLSQPYQIPEDSNNAITPG